MVTLTNGINANSTTPLLPIQGGTGLSSPTAHGVMISEGASAVTPIVLTAGQLLIGTTSGDPAAATLTPGTNVTITSASGAITINAATSATPLLAITALTSSSSPYTVLSSDVFLATDPSGGVVSILLPNAPSTGRVIYVKDSSGSAGTHNITVTTVGGTVTIDGVTSYVLNNNYQAVSIVFDGANYEVF